MFPETANVKDVPHSFVPHSLINLTTNSLLFWRAYDKDLPEDAIQSLAKGHT
jgi:hypothetical protein